MGLDDLPVLQKVPEFNEEPCVRELAQVIHCGDPKFYQGPFEYFVIGIVKQYVFPHILPNNWKEIGMDKDKFEKEQPKVSDVLVYVPLRLCAEFEPKKLVATFGWSVLSLDEIAFYQTLEKYGQNTVTVRRARDDELESY